ncbi:hypothetical protein [Brachybacterium tyrofermentans]|uniref:hypothetical protein n=1 Tax=Brachybacterium tyrofermentans TaxID=47848 RepID=UPI003F8EEBDD
MTSPYSQALPPLTDLPAPRELPREATHLVPPAEIIADSKSALRRRLLRISWAPGLLLLGLWYVLLVLYVVGASPTFWFLTLLVSLGEPAMLRATTAQLGLTGGGLWAAFFLLPLFATVVSLAVTALAPSAIAGMDPRRHLSERGFQADVATRITAFLLGPSVLAVAALPLSVAVGLPQPWSGLGAGQLMAWTLAVGALLLAWILVRRTVSAPTVLGIEPAAALETTGRLDRDPVTRRAAAAQVLGQDRRHLPPNPGTVAAGRALTPRGALTALALIARAWLTWVVPAAVGLGAIIFGIADVVVTFNGLLQSDLVQVRSALHWQMVAVGLPVLALVALAMAFAPGLAVLAAAGQRSAVIDQRTYPSWEHRKRVNPWESLVVALTGWFSAALALLGLVLFAVVLALLGAATALAWVWIVVGGLTLIPLLGAGASAAMRRGLRDVLYGPAGDYMRRETPYSLVAPDIGTRAQRAEDPAVRAEQRRRLQAQGGDHALAIFDLDASGERLWVDDSAPGAKDTAVRQAELAAGTLPDFGGEGSPFTRGDGSGDGQHGADGRHGADGQDGRHGIPDSMTGLRER